MSGPARPRSRVLSVGLGLMVGAVLHGSAGAQARPTRPARDSVARDSVARDTTQRRDTTAAVPEAAPGADTALAKADTIKAPFVRAELPVLVADGDHYRWDRPALFASGALGLVDLLERIPGATGFRSGWIASPAQAVYLGDAGRVRVFLDGLELDALDPRGGDLLDLGEVPLWLAEDAVIERAPGELRVYLRSWEVRKTTPYTRTDIATGEEDTNLYRGFFGRRWRRGQALQIGAQQYGTTGAQTTGGGDALSLFGRVGVARRTWSVDAAISRVRRSRDLQQHAFGGTNIPGLGAVRTDAYLRAGVGQADSGAWIQAVAGSMSFEEEPEDGGGLAPGTAATGLLGPDTTRSRRQYVAAAGFTRWGVRISATNRLRVFDTVRAVRFGPISNISWRADSLPVRDNTLSARLSLNRRAIGVSLFAERGGDLRPPVEEATIRLSPLSFLALSGAVAVRHGDSARSRAGTRMDARGEGAVRLGSLWLGGGVIRRDSALVRGLRVYDTSYVDSLEGPATAVFGTVRGPLWRDLGIDAQLVRWDTRGLTRPQLEVDAELYVRTRWLRKFPSGNFGFLGSARFEYRSAVTFGTGAAALSSWAQALTGRLEIRIVDAVVFYHQRITLRRRQYEIVPGFIVPRQSILYGVRWEFWN